MKKILIIILIMNALGIAQFESSSSRFTLRRQVISSAGSVRTSLKFRMTEYIGVQNFGRMKNINYLLGPSMGIHYKNDIDIPEAFALRRNYPNPFNAQTIIEYNVPQTARINIAVYSLLGQLVCTLVDAQHRPGHYALNFNGRDAFDRPLPSGLYLVRMQASQFSASILVSLLK